MSNLKIVMYHYVREIKASKYPQIKGLEVASFRRQLDYLSAQYTMIKIEDLIALSLGEIESLPDNSCLLTFDDGYKDHIEYVLPELKKRDLQGSFFPPARPILNNDLLDVNALHFILAKADNTKRLLHDFEKLCLANGLADSSYQHAWTVMDKSSRFDSPEIIFFKRMLQRQLPVNIRSTVISALFERYVGESVQDFSRKLYMSCADIKQLISEGMYVGSHTYTHEWLNSLSRNAQEEEIDRSLTFLRELGAATENWAMCYPYGGYNQDTLDLLKAKKCTIGLTTKVGDAQLKQGSFLELERYDTNDFPQ